MNYTKIWKSIDEQINLLSSRGLRIDDLEYARNFLRHINYYRLTGYALPFQESDGQGGRNFRTGYTFEDITHLYFFDRAFRDLMFEASEIIELDFRTTIAYHLGKHSAFAHLDENIYNSTFRNKQNPEGKSKKELWLEEARKDTERNKNLFITSYKKKYSNFPDLPIWMLTEVCSFGAFSRLYSGLEQPFKTRIANVYGLQAHDFASMIHHVVYIRNICAHHARLFDHAMSIQASIPPGKIWADVRPASKTIYSSLIIHKWFLDKCPIRQNIIDEWKEKVEQLITDTSHNYPCILKSMGLANDWRANPIWQQPQCLKGDKLLS